LTRVKNFESTGLAPNGRLYAGDLNAVQDHYADQTNLTQTIGTGSLSLGESGLQLVRYGPSEMRISGALRTDGIFRGLGGLYAGAFTTTQRDALTQTQRPYGLMILNTTTNQYEWNKGTDISPNWVPMSPPVAEAPIGSVTDWPWAANLIPVWALLPYGQAISRSAYSALHSLASGSGYVYGNGDGSTTFNVPDYRGRIGVGKDDMGGAVANRITVGISGIAGQSLGAVGGSEGIVLTTGQIPAHNHGVQDAVHGHSGYDTGHAHGVADPTHAHNSYHVPGANSGLNWLKGGWEGDDVEGTIAPAVHGAATGIGIYADTAKIVVNGNWSGISATYNSGGGGVHTNVQPIVVVNKIMRAI
jgi:microcystin-dependent protein